MLTFGHFTNVSAMSGSVSDASGFKAMPQIQITSEAKSYKSVSSAGKKVRSYLKKHKATFTFYITKKSLISTKKKAKSTASKILKKAYAHTKTSNEGDSIEWNIDHWQYNFLIYGNRKKCRYTFAITYRMTKAQDEEVQTQGKALIKSLDMANSTDYQKVKKIYDWMTSNIAYDHVSTSGMRYTPYNALIKKKAVCEGYALLFYRLCLMAGVNCRFITGNKKSHAWNIVKLNGKYYNVDSTWDAGNSRYRYFLKSNANFTEHTRDKAYNTKSFNSTYKMSTKDYVPVTSLTLDVTAGYVLVGNKGQLTATLVDASSPDVANLKWSSSNKKVATVSSKGVVTGVGEGQCVITASVGDLKATCTLSVFKY